MSHTKATSLTDLRNVTIRNILKMHGEKKVLVFGDGSRVEGWDWTNLRKPRRQFECAICNHPPHLLTKCGQCDHIDPKTTDARSEKRDV